MALPRTAKEQTRAGLRVLLVHHNPETSAACRSLLEKQGYVVDVLPPDGDVIRKIYHTLPDVLISGIQMPELNGYQLCRLLKSDNVTRSIPVVLISDTQEKIDRFWSLKAGADDLVNVEEIRTKLVKKVHTVLDAYSQINQKKKKRGDVAPDFTNVQTRLNQLLDVALTETTLMNEFRAFSDLVHNAALLNYMLFSLLDSILDYDAASIFYYDVGKGPYSLTLQLPEGKSQSTAAADKLMRNMVEELKEASGNPDLHEGVKIEVIGTPEPEGSEVKYKTVYTKHFYQDEEYIGSIRFYSTKKADYENIFPVRLIENEVKWLMRIRHLYSKAEYYATIDAATGLNNYKYFMQTLMTDFKSAKRYELDLSLALVEISDFKRINKQFGFAVGDQLLKEVADLARKTFRSSDLLARYGSREMAVLFVQTPAEEAQNALTRLVENLQKTALKLGAQEIPFKLNVGMTSISEAITSVDDLLAQAKTAVDKSRARGENQIEIYASK